MNDRSTAQPEEKSFDAAVRSYEPRVGGKIKELMAHKKGIAELRSKQASFRTIANLLKRAGVDVSHDTVARFCREALNHTPSRKAPPNAGGNPAKPSIAGVLKAQREAAAPLSTEPGARSRGPRIADPKNV